MAKAQTAGKDDFAQESHGRLLQHCAAAANKKYEFTDDAFRNMSRK